MPAAATVALAAADAGAGGIFVRDLCIELALLTDVGLTIKTTDLVCDSESTIKVLQDIFACFDGFIEVRIARDKNK